MTKSLETVLEHIAAETNAVKGDTRAPDLQRIYNRRLANNQAFTVMIFGMAAMQKLHADVRLLMQMVESHGLAIADVKKVAGALLTSHESILRKRYELTDAADLVKEARTALLEIEKSQDWNRLLTELFTYSNYVTNAIAVLIPWHELSVAFEGARTVSQGYGARLVD